MLSHPVVAYTSEYGTFTCFSAAPAEAALLEPLGVSHNAIEQLEVEGQTLLVTGCGPIGLLACAVAKTMNAKR